VDRASKLSALRAEVKYAEVVDEAFVIAKFGSMNAARQAV